MFFLEDFSKLKPAHLAVVSLFAICMTVISITAINRFSTAAQIQKNNECVCEIPVAQKEVENKKSILCGPDVTSLPFK